MLLNKKAFAVINAASKDENRYSINGLLIEPDGSAVATNGHVLIKFTPAEQENAKEFPKIDGVNPVSEETLKAFILSRDSVEQIKKAVPKHRSSFPILSNIALDVEQTNKNGNAVMAVTDLENPQVFRPQKVDADFPDYRKVVPTDEPKISFGVSVEVLDTIVKTLKATNVKGVKIGVRNAVDALTFEGETNDYDGKVTGAFMPYRL